METKSETLIPAAQMARESPLRIRNESAEYRAARTALLAEEIELRRHLERVATQRRALPPGGRVDGDYRFDGEDGPTDLAGLFGDKQTLAIYSFMFGPDRGGGAGDHDGRPRPGSPRRPRHGPPLATRGPAVEELRTAVKAATFHDLRVEDLADGVRAYVVLDV